MKITNEEKTVLITIVIAALVGIALNFFFSYHNMIQVKEAASEHLLININTAAAADLDRLPGVGKVIAERIIKDRESKKGFKTVEELRNIKGINAKKYEQIKKYVIVAEE